MTAKRFLLVIAAGAGVLVLLLHYKERDSYRCQLCFSTKDVYQWRLGLWAGPSVPLTPAWEHVMETKFLHDLLPVSHRHTWKFAQGSPYYFFGTTWAGCAIGGGRYINNLCWKYDSSPQFRAFVQSKLKDGSITKSNLIALMTRPRTEEVPAEQKEANDLLESFSGP